MEEDKKYNLEEEHYIDDDYLSRNIDLCSNNEKYNLHFCLYNINKDCFIEGVNEKDDDEMFYFFNKYFPFLQFYMKNVNNMYQFPQLEFQCPVFNNNNTNNINNTNNNEITEEEEEDENYKSQSQIYFENECFKFLLSHFENTSILHSSPPDFLTKMYKGFKEFKDKETNTNHIFVFFDITSCIQYFKKEQHILGIIDEIVFKQKIRSIRINPLYYRFFKNNKKLLYLKNGDTVLPFPFQLYMCKKNQDNTLTNIQNGEIISTIEHEVFGPSYIFTTEPYGENIENNIRISCFIIKSIYYLQDIAEKPIENNTKKEEDILYASTIYYHENGIQYWSIKNNNHFTILQ